MKTQKAHLAVFSKTILKNQFLIKILKNISQLFLKLKFYLKTQIWKIILPTYFLWSYNALIFFL